MTLLDKPIPPILADLGLVTKGDASAWAVTDPTDQYRYVLGRTWDDFFSDPSDWWNHGSRRPLWVFGMLNPSKARHDVDTRRSGNAPASPSAAARADSSSST